MQYLGIYKRVWFCRWCGKPYRPDKETERDGFCCHACKQAHHRALKKYKAGVIPKSGPAISSTKLDAARVTQRKLSFPNLPLGDKAKNPADRRLKSFG
jgi:hypothetical protein